MENPEIRSARCGFDHGPRLSKEAYHAAVRALYEVGPPMPSPAQDRARMRRELDLAIDYRLGTAFPPDRRELVWKLRQELERRRLRLALWAILKRLFSRSETTNPEWSADTIMRHYSKALEPDELRAFLELDGPPPEV